ncbi:hypothetical protein [Mycolicibacterium fortuitum]|uniref:hypothetical protein n=1 Tax=Mycolicibacterium fortuitum TaxID=1766 RepID=UPI00261C098E|nr:hypothetical protein [Mycolicibacterium fortuitum]
MNPLWIAPPALLRSSGLAAEGLPYLTDGVHLRVEVHPLLGFPMHPFVAWRTAMREMITPTVRWADARNIPLASPVTLGEGERATGFLPATSPETQWIFVELDIDEHGPVRVDAFGPGGVGDNYIVATRRTPPYRFGCVGITHVRVQGPCTITAVRANSLDRLSFDVPGEPDSVFGLPDGFDWYHPGGGVDPPNDAYQRVKDAAPTQLTPADAVLEPAVVTDTTPKREADRIKALAVDLIAPWLNAGFNNPNVLPVDTRWQDTFKLPGGYPDRDDATVDAPVIPSLLTMAVDPRVSAYLGLATMIPLAEPIDTAGLWVIASRWIVQRGRIMAPAQYFTSPLLMSQFLGSAPQAATLMGQRLEARFPGVAEVFQDRASAVDGGQFGPWTTVTLATLAVAPERAPADPPDPLKVMAAGTEWGTRSNLDDPAPVPWRCELELNSAPRGMLGFARVPGGSSPLHRYARTPINTTTRVLPIIVNRAVSQPAVLTDDTLPAGLGSATWTVWHADLFGQWSQPAHAHAPQPARPAPPNPQPEASYEAYPDDGSTGLRAPGLVHLVYHIPDVSRGAPGASPITSLSVSVDGDAQPPQAVTGGTSAVIEAAPQPTAVGTHKTVTVTSTYTTSTGETSTAAAPCAIYDARPPRPLHTSPIIAWTSFPDSTGVAHIDLSWPAADGAARYRVYLGDARRLAATLAMDTPDGATRAEVAGLIHTRSADLAGKDAFTLLGETTEPQFTATLDGALRNTQFIRVVPLTEGGAESAFASCGLVPIAVPHNEKPPQPSLGVEYTDAAARLAVKATGVAAAFTGKAAPEYRLLKATPGNADPDFAIPHAAAATLTSDDDGASGTWHAQIDLPDADLQPFVATIWWAQCRYPAEAPTDGGAPLPPDGGVHPDWPPLGEAALSLWSLASGATPTVHIPADPPAAPAAPTATRTPAGVTITAAGLPPSTPAMIAPYVLEIYRFTAAAAPDDRYVRIAHPTTAAGTIEYTDSSPTAADRYDLILVDPTGRRSVPTRLPAPP